jgi:hypothetical protein
MNQQNWQAFSEGLKQTPLAGNAEHIHEQYDLGGKSYVRTSSLTETVTLAGGSVNLTNSLPAGAKVRFASIRLIGAMVLTTAVKLGVGSAGSPSAFLLSTVTMADTTTADQPVADSTAARPAAAQPIVLSAVDVAGAAAGTGAGVVKVRVVYEYVMPIKA